MASGAGLGRDDLSHFERLCRAPERFHFFLALRLIEAEFAEAPPLGRARRSGDEKMRLGQEPTMAFPYATISRVTPPGGGRPGRFTNLFFGLFGPHGPLPQHLTEYARERLRSERDPTFTAFADMLTHRSMGLLYRAWATGQPAAHLDRGADSEMERKTAALSGHLGRAFRNRDAMPDTARRHFAGHLGRRAKNADGLVSMLSAFFGAPVRLQQFVGSWLELEQGDRWALGAEAGLGQSTAIGQRVWSRSAKFRLILGPLSLADYNKLLPGTEALRRLTDIVRAYAGDLLDWDLNLILRRADLPEARLGADTRLGQTSWIGTPAGEGDVADLYLTPQFDIADGAATAPAAAAGGT